MIEIPPHQLYEEVRVTPTRTALVVADMQNDFVRPGGSLCVPDAEATIPAIRGLLDLARAHGMHVVYSQDTRRDGDPEWQIWPEHAREGSWGLGDRGRARPAKNETVLAEVRYDACYGTPLDHQLRVWGVDTLVICVTQRLGKRPASSRAGRSCASSGRPAGSRGSAPPADRYPPGKLDTGY